MSRTEAVEMVVGVLTSQGRSDRYLRQADDGHYYTSPDGEFINDAGPYTLPQVKIPFGGDLSDTDAGEWAESLLGELDDVIADAA